MDSLKITPLKRPVKIRVTVPGSKSYTNRALLLAAMTSGSVKLINPLLSDDTIAMVNCLRELGIRVLIEPEGTIEVAGSIADVVDRDYDLDAALSGTTIRFLLALAATTPGQQTLRGGDGLQKRPIHDLVDALRQLGAEIDYLGKDGYPPLLVRSSHLSPGTVKVKGDISSQYLSAVLMISPMVGNVSIDIVGELISKPYVYMTIDAMRHFGVNVTASAHQRYVIRGGQSYSCNSYSVEGDVSSASYFFAIAALTGSTMTVENVNPSSRQADMVFLKILEKAGAKVTRGRNSVTVVGNGVKPLTLNMSDCPDQALTAAVLAAFAPGVSTISGVQSLRVKETERVAALEQELAKMGIKTSSTHDTLVIQGGQPRSATIATYGDHRMAMAFAVACTKLRGMEIQDPGVVSKTFPDFWDKLESIGFKIDFSSPNIVLIGMRGSGKTTVASLLAQKLGRELVDIDTVIQQRTGMTIPQLVGDYGWGYFRNHEVAVTKVVAYGSNQIISTGGGVVLGPQNVAALKCHGFIVLLQASADTLLRRLDDTSNDRPALTDQKNLSDEIRQLLEERRPLYEAAADAVIDTDDLEPEEVVERIIALVKERSA